MPQCTFFRWPRQLSLLTVLCLFLAAGCGASGGDNNPVNDTPCSCTVGAKRCLGDAIQVCEAATPTCPAWGPTSTCPGGACSGDRCPGSCTDSCAGGTSRCSSDSAREVCRIGPSGCLEWVAQSCPATQYCGGTSCQAAIPCDPACPSGYLCKPSGVCAGGSPSGLDFDVKTFTVSGKLTLNGAVPSVGTSCSGNPQVATADLQFVELSKGYVVDLFTRCGDASFGFSGKLFPGTYVVRANSINGANYSNLPQAPSSAQAIVVSPAFVVSADAGGIVFDVQTFTVSGLVTLNGAAPTVGTSCSGNPQVATSDIQLVESTKGYVIDLYTRCGDPTFAFTGKLYPGSYVVRVNNINGTNYSNLPQAPSAGQSFVANAALIISADSSGLDFDVKTITISGHVTLNGAAPSVGTSCSGNPQVATADLQFTEKTLGYVTDLYTRCGDPTFAFTGKLYPGTYSVRINNINGTNYSNLPQAPSAYQAYQAVAAIQIP
jgi:hypothetical protein